MVCYTEAVTQTKQKEQSRSNDDHLSELPISPVIALQPAVSYAPCSYGSIVRLSGMIGTASSS